MWIDALTEIYSKFGPRGCVNHPRRGTYAYWASQAKEFKQLLSSIQGMRKLMFYDVCYQNPRVFNTYGNVWLLHIQTNSANYLQPRKSSMRYRLFEDDISGKENPSDYDPIGIPWGPKWTAGSVSKFVIRKVQRFCKYYSADVV